MLCTYSVRPSRKFEGYKQIIDSFSACVALQGPALSVYRQLTRLSICLIEGGPLELHDDWMAAVQGSCQLSDLGVRYCQDRDGIDVTELTQLFDSLPSLTLLRLQLPKARSPHTISTVDSLFKLARSRQKIVARGGSVEFESMALTN